MSDSKDFNKVDRPEGKMADRSHSAALLEYRDAYHAAKQTNPSAVDGLPDPDGDPKSFDATAALEQLRKLRGKLTSDPRVDLKS